MGAGALSKSRSKSIGHNLHQKMMVLDMERERAEGTKSQMTSSMPWSQSKPPALRRRDANNARNYELRMSKSSDSITAAKMMAMRQMQMQQQNGQGRGAQGLRINQDMSKSMEKQIDVYTKTRDDIRKILQVPLLLKIALILNIIARVAQLDSTPEKRL